MAEYTPNYNLYKPNRLDNDPVDTTLAGNFASIDTEIKNRETEIDDHKASSMAHSSENITHGAVTVQDAIFELNSQIDVLVVSGDSSVEAAQARVKANGTNFTTLQERLNDSDEQLAESSQQLAESVNDYSYTIGFINGLNQIRTRAVLEVNGFYSVDDGTYGKYRVLTVNGTETWTDVKDSNNIPLFQISSDSIRAVGATKKLKIMPVDGAINAKMFGAKGDYNISTGIGNDDTIPIQFAINYAISTNNIFVLPKGVYKTTSTLSVTNGLYMKGVFETDSRGAGSLLYYTGTGTAIDCSNNGNWLYAPKFQHFRIHSSGNANIGLKFSKVTEADILDVHFNQGFNTALYLNNTTITNIERCDFSANKIGIMFAHETSDVQNMAINIKGCNFWQNSIAHVKMNNCLGVNFSNNWFEYSPIGIWIDNDNPGGKSEIVDLNITHNELSVGDATLYPNSKAVKVTTTNNSIDMTVLALNIRENLMYNKSTDYNIVFDLTNSSAGSYIRQSYVDRNLLWGASTSAIYGTDSTKIIVYIRENDCRTSYFGTFGTESSGSLTQYGIAQQQTLSQATTIQQLQDDLNSLINRLRNAKLMK
jgi:hypothetical protein